MVIKVVRQAKRVMLALRNQTAMRGFIDILNRTHAPTCLELSMYLGASMRKALLKRYWTRRLRALQLQQEKHSDGRMAIGGQIRRNKQTYQSSRLSAQQAALLHGLLEALRQRSDD